MSGGVKNNVIMPNEIGNEIGKLFIGGLSWETTVEGLQRYFSRFGEVVDSVVKKDTHTGRSRGFGFVTFADPGNVDAVLNSGPHQLDGRMVTIKRAEPRDGRGGSSMGLQSGWGAMGAMGNHMGPMTQMRAGRMPPGCMNLGYQGWGPVQSESGLEQMNPGFRYLGSKLDVLVHTLDTKLDSVTEKLDTLSADVRDMGTHVRDMGTHVRDMGTHVRDMGTQVSGMSFSTREYNASMNAMEASLTLMSVEVNRLASAVELQTRSPASSTPPSSVATS